MTLATRLGWCAAVLFLALVCLGGCRNDRITAADIRRRPTPELQSMAATKEQRKNVHARVRNVNLRQIHDDLDWLFLTDRPSRMSRYPVP